MWASLGGRDGCVQLLLDRGAQIDHQDEVSAFWDQSSVRSQWYGKYGGCVGNCPQTFVRGRVLPPTPIVIPSPSLDRCVTCTGLVHDHV